MGEEQVRSDITKEECARRQIETAICLFFCEGDEISIHVLASSASEILTDICRAENIESCRDMFMERVKRGWEKFASDKFKEAYNYFKHADHDTYDQLERFHPGTNYWILFSCCYDYQHAFKRTLPDLPTMLLAFFLWYLAKYPEMVLEFPFKEQFFEAFRGMDQKPEREQLRVGREFFARLSAKSRRKVALAGLAVFKLGG